MVLIYLFLLKVFNWYNSVIQTKEHNQQTRKVANTMLRFTLLYQLTANKMHLQQIQTASASLSC